MVSHLRFSSVIFASVASSLLALVVSLLSMALLAVPAQAAEVGLAHSGAGGTKWLLIGGGAAVVAGIVVMVFLRRRSNP